jgi:RNA polymerase sigma-70 factor (ECF subfamily)
VRSVRSPKWVWADLSLPGRSEGKSEMLRWRWKVPPGMEPHADADLVERFLRGDSAAAAQVDGWIAGAAWPFRRRLAAEWDDLLQEIRLEVVRLLQARLFRGESRLKTYLWQVACHTCLDAVRRERRRLFVGLEAAAAVPSSAASPFDSVSEGESVAAALRALSTLSGDCRELWRKILCGMSYREIGDELKVSEAALRVRAHRCRKSAVEAYRAFAERTSIAREGGSAVS